MDVNLAREIAATKTLEEVMTYLAFFGSKAGPPSSLGLEELAAWLRGAGERPHLAEYCAAQKVLEYNAQTAEPGEYHCPLCGNRQFLAVLDESGGMALRECSCRGKRRAIRAAKRSGMDSLLDKTLESYQTQKPWQRALKERAAQYLECPGSRWFAMLGQSGCGKTHLCAAVANAFLEQGREVVYMPWTSASRELKRTALDQEGYRRAMGRYLEAEVLYIDDLWKGKVTETDLLLAFELINARYNGTGLTLLSSEREPEELVGIDQAVAGRIRERCGEYLTVIPRDPGKNYRFSQSG